MAATSIFGLTKPDAGAVGWDVPINADLDLIDTRLALLYDRKAQVASSSAIASSASETAFSESYSLPGLTLLAGETVKIVCSGRFSNTTGSPTLRLRVRYGGVGGVLLADTGAITLDASAQTDMRWRMEIEFTVRTTGVSGTARVSANLAFIQLTGTTQQIIAVGQNNANVTIDTTVAKVLTATAQWGTSSPSNTITQETMNVYLSKN